MIPAVWLGVAGLAGLLGVAAIVYNWDEVLDWLHDFLPKISKMVRAMAKNFGPEFEHAAIMVADVLDSVDARIEHKLYHKIGHQQWMEETTRRTLPEKELPPAVKRKIAKARKNHEEADITDEIEDELGMTLD